MKNFIKTATATVILSLSFGANAVAGDKMSTTLRWSPEKTVEQNYSIAAETVERFCRKDASRSGESSILIRKKMVQACEAQLMDNFVEKVGSKQLAAYHEFKINPVENTTQFASNP